MTALELSGLERHYLLLAVAEMQLRSIDDAARLENVPGKEDEADRARRRYIHFEKLLAKIK